MIFLVQFGINKALVKFSNTKNCTSVLGECNFVSLENFTRVHLFQIALEIMRLPIQIVEVAI